MDSPQLKINIVEEKTIIQQLVPYKGEATANNSPTIFTDSDADLFEKYAVKTAATLANYKDENGNPIVVTQEDLDVNFIEIWVKNGVSEKVLSVKPQPIENITQEITHNTVAANQVVPIDKTYNVEIDGSPKIASDIIFKVDENTGQNVNYRETSIWYDGTTMTDLKVDGYIYKKYNGVFYEKIINRIGNNIDIREFNIVNDSSLDQSFYLDYLANYCDKHGIYEIDFLNYHIMTSKKILFTTNRPTDVRGLGFKKAHKIKNLTIYNDKSVQLKQGQCCIVFYPSENDKTTFELENVNFDPYVSDFIITNSEYDGMMIGFLAHKNNGWDYSNHDPLGYNFTFNNVEFISPAVSYNISTSGIFAQNLTANNLRGEYWGLYIFSFAINTYISRIAGIFRDDLHNNTNRTLVTSLIHFEAEISSNTVTQNEIQINKAQSTKKSTGESHLVFKNHSVGSHHYKLIEFKNVNGEINLYDGKNTPSNISTKTEVLNVDNMKGNLIVQISSPIINVKQSELNKCTICNSNNSLIDKLTIDNSKIGNLSYTGVSGGIIKEFNFINSSLEKNSLTETYGLIRNNDVKIEQFYGKNIISKSKKFIECDFDNINIDGFKMTETTFDNTFFLNSSLSKIAKLTLKNLDVNIVTIPLWTYFIMGTNTAKIDIKLFNAYTGKRLPMVGNTKKEFFVFPIEKGNASQRPVLTSEDVGYQYYDTSVGKLICWNGSEWS